MKSLGITIKEFRVRKVGQNGKPYSQLELSLLIGWENPSTLSPIESDEVVPTRNTIIKIGRALELTSKELNILLKIANYSEFEPSITQKYISEIRNSLKEDFELYSYPVFVQTYTGEIIYWNSATIRFFVQIDLPDEEIYKIFFNKTFIEVLFDPMYGIRPGIDNWNEFSKILVENMYYMKELLPNDQQILNNIDYWMKYSEFKEHWETLIKTEVKHRLFNLPFIYKHPFIGEIHFSITTSFLYLDKRFVIQQVEPASHQDLEKVNKFLQTVKE